MTDCDLCGRGIPTVIPVRVFRPLLKFAYPEVSGKGSVRPVSIPPRKPTQALTKKKSHAGKTNALSAGEKADFTRLKSRSPISQKGVIIKEKNVCSKCLEAVNEAYLRHQREEIDEEGWIHGHEHVHEH
jgi:F420H2 dehydrogenase subunit O